MRGLLPGAGRPVISGLPDAGVSHPSSERLRRPPSPSRGEGTVGRPLEDDGRFFEAELAPVIVGFTHAATLAVGRGGSECPFET
jgi:hypothetical protein